jgi:hypothetical protein
MPDPQRHKVGDRDPEGEQALRDAIAGKPTPPVKETPETPAPKKKRERRYGPKGQTLDEVIDDAINGAKGANPDY